MNAGEQGAERVDIVKLPESKAIFDTEQVIGIVNPKLNEYAILIKGSNNALLATGTDVDVLLEHMEKRGTFTRLVAPPKVATA